MQIGSAQKKYIFWSIGGTFLLGFLLVFFYKDGVFNASLLSDKEAIYNNPLEDSYKPTDPSYSMDMNTIRTSSYEKEYTPATLGTAVSTNDTASGALQAAQVLNIKNLRISYADTDPLSEDISSKILSARKTFAAQIQNVFSSLHTDTAIPEARQKTLTIEEFLKTTASGTLFAAEPGTVSIALNMAYAYNPVSETAEHLTGPVVQNLSGALLINDVSTELAKAKNIPLIAQRNQDIVKEVKKILEEAYVKRGMSGVDAQKKAGELFASHIFFVFGDKISAPENGYLDPVTYGKVVIASLVKMKEVMPEVQVALDIPGTFAVSDKNREDGEWWAWGTKYNLKDLFQMIAADPAFSLVKNNIKELSLALPDYTHWKESLRAVNTIADANGFSGISLRISTSDDIAKKDWNTALVKMKSFLELSARKDISGVSIFRLFSDLAGINVNGYWSDEPTKQRDLYLASQEKDILRMLPLGALTDIFQNMIGEEHFTLRVLRSSDILTEFFGSSKNGKRKGIVMNMSDIPKTYTLKNSSKMSVSEVKNMTATGTLIEEFGAEEIKNVKMKEPFIFGVNGHPTNQESYKQVKVGTTTEGVPLLEQLDYIKNMGMTSYRVDVGVPSAQFDTLVSEAKKRDIFILPVIFPPVNLDNEPDLAKIEKISYDYALNFAEKYKNDIPVWELQNEMDNYTQLRKGDMVNGQPWPYEVWMIDGNTKEQHEEGRSAKVAAMMKGLTNGVHKADPKLKTTINAGWLHFGYIQRMVEAGVNFDILSWHWYSNMGDITKVRGSFDLVAELSKFGKDIWITEGNRWGGDMENTGKEQAEYVEDIIEQMKNVPQIKAYYFYELLDEPYFGNTNPESHFGFYQMKKGDLGTWVVDKAKPAVDAVKNSIEKVRVQESSETPTFQQGTLTKEELSKRYTAALRSEVFPAVTHYTVVPNLRGESILTLPPKSVVYLTEEFTPHDTEKLLLESVETIRNTRTSYLPTVVLEPQTMSEPNQNENLNVNTQTNINRNVNASAVNQNVSVPPVDKGYVGAGNTSVSLGTLNQNQNLRSSAPATVFRDIAGNFAEEAIMQLASRNIIQGRAPGRFEPSGALNRAEGVKLAIKAFGNADEKQFLASFTMKHPAYTYVYFKDVLKNAWYAGFVGIAYENKIVAGTSPVTFEPARNVTRAEFLKMILEASPIDIEKTSKIFASKQNLYFKDTLSSSWYRTYVFAAAEKGIIETRSLFEPNRNITRAEAAKILYMTLNMK